jgi:hypothetical protein
MKKTNLLAFSGSVLALLGASMLVACGDDTVGTGPNTDGGGSGTASGTSGTTGTTGTTGTSGSTTDGGGADATVDGGGTGSDGGPDATLGDAAADAGDAASDASDAATFPAPPTLGAEIDRFGRPAVNTALDHTFDTDPTDKGAAKDAYNANGDAGSWVAAYTSQFEANLAIYDSLDTTASTNGCGNQPFFGPADAGPAAYGTLAGLLADDRLWLNTATTSCTQYLGVELVATGKLTAPDGGVPVECGGRTPSMDVIQTTYSIVAGVGLTGFGSGVTASIAKTTVTSFPYFQVITQ